MYKGYVWSLSESEHTIGPLKFAVVIVICVIKIIIIINYCHTAKVIPHSFIRNVRMKEIIIQTYHWITERVIGNGRCWNHEIESYSRTHITQPSKNCTRVMYDVYQNFWILFYVFWPSSHHISIADGRCWILQDSFL